jgi:hypothetical protein
VVEPARSLRSCRVLGGTPQPDANAMGALTRRTSECATRRWRGET